MGMELEFNEEVFKWDNGLLKSVANHRQYRCITLPNGLKALLIHDPEIQVDNSHKDDDDDDDKDNSDANVDEEINRVQGKEEKGGKSSTVNGDKKSHVTPRKRWRTSTNAITALRRMTGMAAETERGKAQKDASTSSEETKDKSNANPLRRWRTSTATITAIRRLEELVAQTERMRAKTAQIHDSSERTQSADKEGAAVTGGVKGTKAVPVAEVAAPAAVPDSSSKDMVAECSALDDDSPSGTVESKMPSKELRSTQETEKEKIGEADETTVPECEAEGDESSVDDEVEEHGKEKEDEPGFTKDAAVAICIKIGSIYDPEDSYGLAHFLEHMLFMGSEKFPEEDEYDSFLSEHGGGSNACTAMDYTCYYFVVDQDHLRPALERFSQFFVSPLLRQDAIEREVLAVESEFKMTLQSDSHKSNQFQNHVVKQGHPYCRRFACGNKDTLGDPATEGGKMRERVANFCKSYYTGDKMHLAVLGGEDLDTLEKWVQKMFCGISHGPSVPLEAKWEGGSPWERSGVIYRLESVLDTPVLRLIWSVPAKFYGREPTSAVYVTVLLGHEGPGSLAAFLKDLGLVTSLMTWSDDDEHLSTMNLASTLTKKGHEQVLDVIGYCHQYIKMLQDKGPQEWFWKEMKQMEEVHARFEQEAPSVSHVRQSALLLSLYPKEIALVGCSLYMSWKPELIQELLGCLNPSNLLITVSDKTSFGKNAPGVLVEPVYSTSYIIDTVPDDILKEWENPTSVQADFCLPSPNPFIPEEFTLRCLSQTSPPKGEGRESLKEDEGEGEGKTGGHNESEGSATNIKAVEEGTSKQTDQVCSESDSNTTTINEAEEGTNVVEQNVQRMATDDTREADGSTYPAGKDDHKDQLAEAIAGTTPAAGGNHDKQPLNKGAELKQGEGQQQDGGKLACWTKVKPEVIYEDDFIKMWHMMDFKVKTPRTTLYLKLSTGQIHRTARGIALLKLFTVILNDALEKELFSASLAGLGFSVEASESYISVIVHGFSHKLPVYAKTLCESLSKVKLEPMRFEAKKDMIVRAYGDLKIDVDDHLVSLRSDLLFTGFSNEEIGEAFATISLEDMRDFIPDMVDQIRVEGFAHGNLLAGEALAFVNVLKEALPLHLTRLCERVKTEFYVLKPGVVYLASEPAKNEDEENSVVEVLYQIIPEDDDKDGLRNRAIMGLIVSMMEKRAFDQLRTKEQLGYAVSVYCANFVAPMKWFQILVESAEYSPHHIRSRVDDFVKNFRKELMDMPEKKKESHVRAHKAALRRKYRSLFDEGSSLWEEIGNGTYDFDLGRRNYEILGTIAKGDLIAWYDKNIISEMSARKIAIQIWGKEHKDKIVSLDEDGLREADGTEEPGQTVVIRDQRLFQTGLSIVCAK